MLVFIVFLFVFNICKMGIFFYFIFLKQLVFSVCAHVSLGLLLLINVQSGILISDDNTRKCTAYSLLDKCAHRWKICTVYEQFYCDPLLNVIVSL